MNEQVKSKITGGPSHKIFQTKVLGKHCVSYFKCEETGFIQTEDPYWLDEAYSNAITALDIGLISRNLRTRDITATVIESGAWPPGTYVDFGGGYGMFVRLMRDFGYDFYRSDPYCENIFANGFDWENNPGERASLLTAWEVFEHLSDPVQGLNEMMKISDNVLFSTLLIPHTPIRSADDWWYFIPETGQHVSLYTEQSLRVLAGKFDLHYYSDGLSLHLFTRQAKANPFTPLAKWRVNKYRYKLGRFISQLRRENKSLLSSDFDRLRQNLNSGLRK